MSASSKGCEVAEQHAIAFIRPHLLVNLAHVAFFTSDFDEAERVARRTLLEARDEDNGNVETTALLLLVRLAVRRREFDEARSLLCEAIGGARRMGSIGLELDAVFCFAEVLAGEGAKRDAAGLMRYYIGRPEIEPGDRTVVQAELDRLGDEATGAAPPTLDLDALLAQIVEQARKGQTARPEIEGLTPSRPRGTPRNAAFVSSCPCCARACSSCGSGDNGIAAAPRRSAPASAP